MYLTSFLRLDVIYCAVSVSMQEELLALSERMGHFDSSLSDNFIADHLKTKTFASFKPSHTEDQKPSDEEPSFCVICQVYLTYKWGFCT